MEFTAEQQQAVFIHDRNLIVTAGAGSGKTRVLVERYLTLLDHNPDWKLTELVAITFTEKAAREMRDRVRATLRERMDSAPIGAESGRWREHYGLLDNARIGTIHSLCVGLLRANPEKVPVDPAFEVLDENEAALLNSDAVEQTLAEMVGGEHPSSELLTIYSVNEVRKMLKKALPEADALRHLLPADQAELLAGWAARRADVLDQWLNRVRSDADLWDNLNWSPPQGWEGVLESGDKLAEVWLGVHQTAGNLQAGAAEIVYETLAHLQQAIRLNVGSLANWGGGDVGKATLAEAKAVLRNIREAIEDYLEAFPKVLGDDDVEMARLLYLWREALHLAAQTYTKLKAERAALDFDDLEVLTAQLLKDYPEVAERYAKGEYKHVMVDEFQDTNSLQRDIVYQITGVEIGNAGRLFVVGDPKQSIYAFRGADVSVFHAVRQSLLLSGGIDLPLSQSFRTHSRLVEVFNDLFSRLLLGGESYEVPFGEAMSASRASQTFHGEPVEILLLDAPQEPKLSPDDLHRWEAYEIAQTIHARVKGDTYIFDKEENEYRRMNYGDVAILFRSLVGVTLYEDVFKACELPYITIAGTGYYDRQEVWDMLNLLRTLHNPADNLALASVLRSPMFGVSDEGLFALRLVKDATGRPLPLGKALEMDFESLPFLPPQDDHAALTFARDCLAHLRGLAGRVTVDELLETALDQTAYDAVVTALPDGDRRRGNLEKLLQKARQSGRISLGEFMAYLRDLTAVEPREGEAAIEAVGAVKIMTVHKSKGLEFPFVVLANADRKPHAVESPALLLDAKLGAACALRADDNSLIKCFAYQDLQNTQIRREAAEHIRLLYVAATRAQDYLLISGAKEDVKGSWLKMILAEGELEGTHIRHVAQVLDQRSLSPAARPKQVGWDELDQVKAGGSLPDLVQPLPAQTVTMARHLSVTQLEELGGAPFYRPPETGQRAFRQSVLHDAPSPIYPIYRRDGLSAYGKSRVVGSMVHRALQVGALPEKYAPDKLRKILEAYAWDEYVSDPATLEDVVADALWLLERFEEPQPLRSAELRLREVPFIFQTERRILHGTLDVLYQSGGKWYVLDYKTANIRAENAHWHSKRYHLQVGAYAEAVRARTGQTPVVQLYYLHPATLIEVSQAAWEAALAQLDLQVDEALNRHPQTLDDI